ncbi:hypothetical protein ACOSQ3_015137 [Xanthoceras sorbifolium]
MASESSFVQPSIPKFDGHYDHWAMLMENFLCSKEYWGLIEIGIPAAAEGTVLTDAQRKHIEDQKLKDLKVKIYLFQALDRLILETVTPPDPTRLDRPRECYSVFKTFLNSLYNLKTNY